MMLQERPGVLRIGVFNLGRTCDGEGVTITMKPETHSAYDVPAIISF